MSDTAVTPTHDSPTIPAPVPSAPALQPHPDMAVHTLASAAPVGVEAPRLGSGPITEPAPMVGTGPTLPTATEPVLPTLPAANAAPVATPPAPATVAPARQFAPDPDLDVASLPTLPQAGPVVSVFESIDELTDQVVAADAAPTGKHPMAHLMPARSKPTEASIKAAEIRATKKAKAKKVKILVVIGALIVTALVGPPFVSWLTGAINEAGDTSTETGE